MMGLLRSNGVLMKVYLKFRQELEKRHLWEVFIYLFFGGLATVVNIVTYMVAKELLGFDLVWSNTFSWIAAVLFAFVTNKLWVFHSKTEGTAALLLEFGKFVFYRILSFVMDMGVMILLIDILHVNDLVSKIITQVLVVVANYLFSKLFIFKPKDIEM